jgi:hypothetical protein
LLRQTTRGTLAIILLKTLLLFAGIGQFMETIRQLNTFEVDLKAFRHAVIFGADLRQRGLACREVVDKRRTVFADMRLNAHGEQQLQQGIAVFFSICDIA